MLIRINELKKSWLVLILAVALVIITGCNGPGTTTSTGGELAGSFKIIGSNTVTPLTAVWAEEFMKTYPKVNIAVSGPGSGAGIAALINGTTDICQASRPIKQKEMIRPKPTG